MLLGSMLGDALGGPLEFDELGLNAKHTPNLRAWPKERKATPEDIREWARSLQLYSYETLRPDTAPYGPWQPKAAAGTVTDDSRHKLILMDALRGVRDGGEPLTRRGLAEAYLRFDQHPCLEAHPHYKSLNEEGHREFRKTARWVLGERDAERALPPERLWAGVPTCCGQMSLLPLAGAFPGRPDKAYRAAFELSFFDNASAKDINPAIVAGLATALTLQPPTDADSRREAWKQIEHVMLDTDPYRYRESPYTKRPTEQWIGFAHDAVQRADGVPKKLYHIFAEEARREHWWEAQLILVIVLASAEFCDYDPLAAMHLILDFGYDTDSSAQVLGAFVGALHGPEAFPPEMLQQVDERFRADFLDDPAEWARVLTELSDSDSYPVVVAGQSAGE